MNTDNIVFVYVCAHRKYELFDLLCMEFPNIAAVTTCTGTSSEAVEAVPKDGNVVVLTNDIFHPSTTPSASGSGEEAMTGAILAQLIKEKNRNAKVYLLSQSISNKPVFDGTFRTNLQTAAPSEFLRKFLEYLDLRIRA